MEELRALELGRLDGATKGIRRHCQGDEVLDWREMTGRYPGATIRLLPGGDHALSDFDDHIDAVFDFLDLN